MTEWYWHIHHDVLVEPLTEPIENRIRCINKHKPAVEIETRLQHLKPVSGALPPTLVEAWQAYDEAWRAYQEAWHVYEEALRAYDEAKHVYAETRRAYDEALRGRDEVLRDCAPAVEALHAAECPDCPWDGKTIFPGGE